MLHNRPSRQRAFQQSRFMRSKPTKRHFFQSFTTQRSARSRLYVHASPVQEVNSSKTVVRITLGLLLLHVVIIGGVLIHENMGKSTQAPPAFSKKPDAAGPGELGASATTPPAKQPTPEVKPSNIATARDATFQGVTQEVAAPLPSEVAVSTIPPVDPANPSGTEPVEVVAVIDTPAQGNTLTAVNTTPRAHIVDASNASAQQRRQAQRGSYKSAAGETWSHVAAKHQISVTALKEANPELLHYGELYPGAMLVIPSSTPAPQPPPFRPGGTSGGGVTSAVVVSAATRDPISLMDPTYTDPDELIEKKPTPPANNAQTTDGTLRPVREHTPSAGDTTQDSSDRDTTTSREPAPAQDATSIYSIRRGDTLSRVAKRHGMTLNALLKLNNIPKSRAGRIKPGQKIKVTTKKSRR